MTTGRTIRRTSVLACCVAVGAFAHAQDNRDVLAPNRNTTVARPMAKPPVLNELVTNMDSVVVKWADGGDNTTSFSIYKRNPAGAWAVVATIQKAAGNDSTGYQWADAAKNVSGQCYRVAARTGYGTETAGPAECTVRPDGFPTGAVDTYKKWYGLSKMNQGVGKLRRVDISDDQHLVRESQRFGVNLGLGEGDNNLKLQRTGNNPEPLMFGEKVAMRVWGAGWVKYGTEAFGINLQLSDTPSYEWIVLGGEIGKPIDDQRIALWNTKDKAFVVPGSRTWGVQMVWRGGAPTVPSATTPQGAKSVRVSNCSVDRRSMGMWVLDYNGTSGWVDSGKIEQQYDSGGSCPAGNPPWRTTLIPGHRYLIEAIDYTAPGCINDPEETQGSCAKSSTWITGGDGPEYPVTIS
jgi:hypothetical protein